LNSTYMDQHVTVWSKERICDEGHCLVGEEPLAIRIQDSPLYSTMRTPGDESAHAAGFCLSQGLVEQADDIAAIDVDDSEPVNTVNVVLHESIQERMAGLFKTSRSETGPDRIDSSCLMDELCRCVPPAVNGNALDINHVFDCIDSLADHQDLRRLTRASHAAAIFGSDYGLKAVSEDVGRHNALDKSIGKLFLSGRLSEAAFLVLSSRISFELVQKAARARIPVIVSVSRPTALAVRLGSRLNMTLACMAKGTGLYVFCGRQRLLK